MKQNVISQPSEYNGPDGLYAVVIPYIPKSVCKLAYAARHKTIDDSMICAGVAGKDSCQVSAPASIIPLAILHTPREARRAWRTDAGLPSFGDEDDRTRRHVGLTVFQGDSGGPLTNSFQVQVGVVSWGIGCGNPGFAGVYADLGNNENRRWIKDKTGIA